MKTGHFHSSRAAAAGAALLLITSVAHAAKPEWAGKGGGHEGGKARGHEARQAPQQQRAEVRMGAYFTPVQVQAAQGYYGERFRAGHCPPGLAKKNNGCLPPGQAKKWAVGQPLPAGIVYYPVPQAVVVQLGVPPAGHKYVRVAADILLIAVGTGLVVDAIQDLGRL